MATNEHFIMKLVARASRPFESKHTGETPVPLLLVQVHGEACFGNQFWQSILRHVPRSEICC
jgi:hypothetical protein